MAVFTDHFAQRFRVLAPDLRGYGRSQVRHPFTMTDHLLDLDRLLDEANIERCLILGWSLGGILALEMALRSPARVSGLILIATSARPWGNHPAISWQDNALTGVAALVNQLRPGWQPNIDWVGKQSLFRHLIQQHTPETYTYLAQAAVPAYLQTSQFATQALYQAIQQGYNRLADLPQIQSPCLVLAGECDRHITAASSQEMLQYLPNAQWCCYPKTAHLFPWEVPTQVLAEIDRWLQQFPQTTQP
jgi:pimeloyl-ACP methyl ester carboxylesterase